MTRLLCSGEADLLAIRFARSPAWETYLAVRTFVDERARAYHEPWHAAVDAAAARIDLAPLLATNPLSGFVPDFVTPPPSHPAPALHEQLEEIRETPLDRVAAELERCLASSAGGPYAVLLASLVADPATARELLADRIEAAWNALVAPFWPRLVALIDADVAYRSRRLAAGGLRSMLADLHPDVRWADGAIEVDDAGGVEVDLAGRGIVLMPSAFVWPFVAAVVDGPWQPTVAYPARGIAELWADPRAPARALARLLGQTRASLLAQLDEPESTTALARRLGRSTSGVSGHLMALRDAGLVAATRHRHELRYARTALGLELVRAAAG